MYPPQLRAHTLEFFKSCSHADARLCKIVPNLGKTGKTGTIFMFFAQSDNAFSSLTCFMAFLAHVSAQNFNEIILSAQRYSLLKGLMVTPNMLLANFKAPCRRQ